MFISLIVISLIANFPVFIILNCFTNTDLQIICFVFVDFIINFVYCKISRKSIKFIFDFWKTGLKLLWGFTFEHRVIFRLLLFKSLLYCRSFWCSTYMTVMGDGTFVCKFVVYFRLFSISLIWEVVLKVLLGDGDIVFENENFF